MYMFVYVCVCMVSWFWLFATPGVVARQVPLSMFTPEWKES